MKEKNDLDSFVVASVEPEATETEATETELFETGPETEPNLQESLRNKKQEDKRHPALLFFNVTYRVLRSVSLIILSLLVMLGFFAAGTGIGYFTSIVNNVKVPEEQEFLAKLNSLDQKSKMTYSNGEDIAVIKSDLSRTAVKDEDISELIKLALIATEDEAFYEHSGIVPKSIIRATLSDTLGIGAASGGSTLTQQLIKQQVLTNETSYERKAAEMMLALKAETLLSKEQILEHYLNVSPFGRNNRGENIAGVEEAAMGIFGIHASEVNLPQAAFLAGLPQSPIVYSPYTNEASFKDDFSIGLNRKDDVLFNMYRQNYIDKEEYEDAKNYNLVKDFIEPKAPSIDNTGFLYHYVYDEAVKAMMPSYYDETGRTEEEVLESEELYAQYFERAKQDIGRGGYTIETTINKDIYNAMQEAVDNYGYVLNDGSGQLLETGSVLMNNETGEIYGFIGGRDYSQNQLNHAFQTRRSPGSTIKPILAYAPAIDIGLIGSESRLSDFPLTYKNGQEVKNYSDTGSNTFKTAREALTWSLNIPVVNLYQELLENTDPKTYFDKMNIGLNPDEYYRESIALGGTDEGLSVLEETEAFATLANRGVYNQGYSISRIIDSEGNILYEHNSEPVDVFKPSTASIMNDMMRDVVKKGTGMTALDTLSSINPTLANADWVGKTGTSENQRDYWFTASTPGITLSSWIGYDDNQLMADTWNKQNMIFWSYVSNQIYQANSDIFKVSEKFTLDETVKEEKVVEFTGEKVNNIEFNNKKIYLENAPTTTSLFATEEGAVDSKYSFGIGGTEENHAQAWNSFFNPKAKIKPPTLNSSPNNN